MKVCKNYFLVFVLALGLLISPVAVNADQILDFGVIAPTSGSISFAGGVLPLVGTNIQVDNVTRLDTGVAYNILNGLLNFTTGELTGFTTTTWEFGGGPTTSILIVGTIDVDKSGTVNDGDITGTLLTGTFGTAKVLFFGTSYKIAGSAFSDTKDLAMLELFGLPNMPYSGNFNMGFNAYGLPPNGFSSSTVLSGDVTNSPIPEPATMLLLGSGLLGIGIIARRKFKK